MTIHDKKTQRYALGFLVREQVVDLPAAELDIPLGSVSSREAVVLVEVAGGAEGLVVEGCGAGGAVKFELELVERGEAVGGGGELEGGRGEELLVAAVEEAGDLSGDEAAWADEEAAGAIGGRGELGGAVVAGDANGWGGRGGGGREGEAGVAEGGDGIVEGDGGDVGMRHSLGLF